MQVFLYRNHCGEFRRDPFGRIRRQDGMALVSALYILAAVAFLAAGMSSDTLMGYKIAGNRRSQQQVFYLADAGANIGVQIVRDIVVNRMKTWWTRKRTTLCRVRSL